MSALEAVRAIVRADCAGWGGVDPQAVQVESTDATEWHTVLFLTSPAAVSEQQADDGAEKPPRQLLRKLVANIPSWRGATLLNKAAASRHLGAVGLAPAVATSRCRRRLWQQWQRRCWCRQPGTTAAARV
jgi:hypothetical protein